MMVPDSLPARFFLLAYDERRQRPVAYQMHYALRAAALTDLWLRGLVVDLDNRPRVAPGASAASVADPVLAQMLRELATGKAYRWENRIRRTDRAIRAAVRDQLVAAGVIRSESRRRLLFFHADRVTIRDPLLLKRLRAEVAATLRPHPISDLDRRGAALTALLAAGEVRATLPRAVIREHQARLRDLQKTAGPAAPALHKAIQHARASSSGGG
jgi:hypothetical protein